jgi:hypothetical protein
VLLTNSSRYPDREVQTLVEFAMAGIDHSTLAVRVRNSRRAYRGRAYDGDPPISPLSHDRSVTRLVTLGLGTPEQFPCTNVTVSARWLRLPPDIDPRSLPRGEVRRARRKGARYTHERRVWRTHGYGGVRSPIVEFRDWRDALVAVAAHEARHIWQYQSDERRSEVDAERYAVDRLTRFRAEPPAVRARFPRRA